MSDSVGVLLRFVRSRATPPPSDRELLGRFVEGHDQVAFMELIERHGRLVFGVCRRILHDGHDAEDAFQATFLLLSRKASSIREPEKLGAWLHGVAGRIARKTAVRRDRRRSISFRPEHAPCMLIDERAEALNELQPILDEAIRALPAKYREPVILCYLQGLTNAEVAHRLGCPLGTVATRLSRARDLLYSRLVRRGIVIPAAMLPTLMAQTSAAALPSIGLRESAAAQITAPATAKISLLTEGIGRIMLMEKSRWLAGAVVVMSTWTVAALCYRSGASEPPSTANAAKVMNASKQSPPALEGPEVDEPTKNVMVRLRHVQQSLNFNVQCAEPRCARLIAEMAELQRRQLAKSWLGKELPRWDERCEIQVKITSGSAKGATSMSFPPDKANFSSSIEGPLDYLLADVLPAQVAHAVLATHFGKPVPRWVDEGIAIMSESPEEQVRLQRMIMEMAVAGRTVKVKELLTMKDYPRDVMVLYVQGHSLTEFLVKRKDRTTLLRFVKDGMDGDWNKAAANHYGFRDLDEMDTAWRAELPNKAPEARAHSRAVMTKSFVLWDLNVEKSVRGASFAFRHRLVEQEGRFYLELEHQGERQTLELKDQAAPTELTIGKIHARVSEVRVAPGVRVGARLTLEHHVDGTILKSFDQTINANYSLGISIGGRSIPGVDSENHQR
jgi:RNA polymerase sigma factor (sigma-70 family)